jgi:hypothetical protein
MFVGVSGVVVSLVAVVQLEGRSKLKLAEDSISRQSTYVN